MSIIKIDLEKYRAWRQQEFRNERKPLLDQLDVLFMRALERGDQELMLRIADAKQALRDVTKDPAIAAAKTPEELRAVRPAALDAKPPK
jgi:hypothetical protein